MGKFENALSNYWLNGRWFPQIVDRDSGRESISNIYIYIVFFAFYAISSI